MPVTGDRGQAVILAARRGQPPPVARAHQCLIQLAFDHGLDETAHPIAHPSFDRIEPIVEKIHSWFANRLRRLRLRDNVLHGVVSYLTLQKRRIIRGCTPRRLRPLKSTNSAPGRRRTRIHAGCEATPRQFGGVGGGCAGLVANSAGTLLIPVPISPPKMDNLGAPAHAVGGSLAALASHALILSVARGFGLLWLITAIRLIGQATAMRRRHFCVLRQVRLGQLAELANKCVLMIEPGAGFRHVAMSNSISRCSMVLAKLPISCTRERMHGIAPV